MRDNTKTPIFITGAQRSGTSLIARILAFRKVHTGQVNAMFESASFEKLCNEYLKNEKTTFPSVSSIPINSFDEVQKILLSNDYTSNQKWLFKSALLTMTWRVWNYHYPNAKWIIVRRKTSDIVTACLKTGYLKRFKDTKTLEEIGAEDEETAWRWWIHQFEDEWVKMIQAGLNCKVIWPDRMVEGNYSQIYEMLEWLGITWDSGIVNDIDPLLNKSRR